MINLYHLGTGDLNPVYANPQVVGHQFLTVDAWVQSHVRSCWICGRQSGTVTGFLREPQFPLPILIPLTGPLSFIIIDTIQS
jgi:hypothetical protein